jgi:hypothetical protein
MADYLCVSLNDGGDDIGTAVETDGGAEPIVTS